MDFLRPKRWVAVKGCAMVMNDGHLERFSKRKGFPPKGHYPEFNEQVEFHMHYITHKHNINALLQDLKHSKEVVRARAAEELARLEGDQKQTAIEALIAALDDRNSDVRYAVLNALGELHASESVPRLIQLLQADEEPFCVQAAISALGQIGDIRATQPLIQALKQGSDEVRFQAITALCQVNPEEAPRFLRDLVKDRDEEVRASAAAGLGDLRDHASVEILAGMLEDPVPTVQMEAAVALARLEDSRGVPHLVDFLKNREFKILAAEYLFRCPDARAIPQLHSHLTSWFAPSFLKVYLAGALAKLDQEVGQAHLIKTVESKNPAIRGLTLQVLGDLNRNWSRNLLKKLKESESSDWADWQEAISDALKESETKLIEVS